MLSSPEANGDRMWTSDLLLAVCCFHMRVFFPCVFLKGHFPTWNEDLGGRSGVLWDILPWLSVLRACLLTVLSCGLNFYPLCETLTLRESTRAQATELHPFCFVDEQNALCKYCPNIFGCMFHPVFDSLICLHALSAKTSWPVRIECMYIAPLCQT